MVPSCISIERPTLVPGALTSCCCVSWLWLWLCLWLCGHVCVVMFVCSCCTYVVLMLYSCCTCDCVDECIRDFIRDCIRGCILGCVLVVLVLYSCCTHFLPVHTSPTSITLTPTPTYSPSVKNHMECKSAANAKRFTRLSVALGTPWKEARNSTKTSNAEDGRFVRECIVRVVFVVVLMLWKSLSLCVYTVFGDGTLMVLLGCFLNFELDWLCLYSFHFITVTFTVHQATIVLKVTTCWRKKDTHTWMSRCGQRCAKSATTPRMVRCSFCNSSERGLWVFVLTWVFCFGCWLFYRWVKTWIHFFVCLQCVVLIAWGICFVNGAVNWPTKHCPTKGCSMKIGHTSIGPTTSEKKG